MNDEDTDAARLAAILAGSAPGTPPGIVLMRLLMEAPSEALAHAALARVTTAHAAGADGRFDAVAALWRAHPDAWRKVRAVSTGIAHDRDGDAPDDTLRHWAEAFDRLVAASPEASVALYSLGSPALLAEATEEVCTLMASWGLLGPDRDALDLGCGIGRFLVALAPRLRSVTGLDLSAGMVTEAMRRTRGLANVRVLRGTGRDLEAIASASLDLVLAADVFPYLVKAGGGVAATHIRELARVLKGGGRALILNYSYGDDLDRDRSALGTLAAKAGLGMERAGTRDLHGWDAAAFLLVKPG